MTENVGEFRFSGAFGSLLTFSLSQLVARKICFSSDVAGVEA